MILDREGLRTALFGRVGFYNPSNPEYPNLVPSLLGSRSGMYVNEAHDLLDIENIDQSVKNFSHFVYPDYLPSRDAAGEYEAGSKVKFLGKNWEYINAAASVGGNPPPDGTYWKEINELSDYLIKKVYTGIDRVMNDWIKDKKMRSKIKSIYDNVLLFNGIANYRNPEPNKNHFVGLRIRMKRGEKSLVAIINRLGHQFDASFNGLNIFIFHSSQQEAISRFTIDHTTAKSQQWSIIPEDQENKLRYISEEYDAGGDFFIGYKQSELESLGGQALKMDLDWTAIPCDCDSQWRAWHKQWSPFLSITGFEIEESSLGAGDTLFDPDLVGTTVTNNYGLNLNLSSKCDIGYFILQNQDLFDEALQLGIGKVLMEGLANNIRGGNQIANQIRSEAKKEIFHSKGVYGTLYDRYNDAIKAVSFDLSGLAEECFPCDDGSDNPDMIIGTKTLR